MRSSRSLPSFGIYALVVVLGIPSARAAAQNTAPRFERTACDLPLPASYPRDITRECGFVVVPEVRGRANGKTFRIAVVTYRAKEPSGAPPLLLVHGGPGGVGGTRFVWTEMLFPLVRKRDVITYDMRGVSASEPEVCPRFADDAGPAFDGRTRGEWEEAYRAAVRACVASIDAQSLDRTAYGADVNAADAIDLRHALGYATWDAYGVSYGGLVVQELLRLDPQGIHAAVLGSTVAPGPDNPAQVALAFQRNVERVFASCAAQPACHRAFPTLEEDFYALHKELSSNPVQVAAQGASPPKNVWLNGERFLMEVRREFGQPASIRRLPLLISELRRGDRDAALRRLIGNGVVPAWSPLGRLVQCNEYGADYRKAVAAVRPTLHPAFQTIADDFREHCDLWLPKPTRQADRRPIVSETPTLVLHGEFDPMDTRTTQKRMTAKLTHAYTYTFPGESHAGPPLGCHGSIVQQFLENPTRAPDSSCLARMPGIQFKTRGFEPTVTFVITAKANASTPFGGSWEATLGGGPDWTIQLDAEGTLVRGMVLDQLLPISEGTIDGATLSFKMKSPDGARTITFTGRLQNDEISFTRDVEVVPGGNPGGPGLLGGTSLRVLTAKRVR